MIMSFMCFPCLRHFLGNRLGIKFFKKEIV
jgi:hypothetical protein